MSTKNALVWIVMGSVSDAEKMRPAEKTLNHLGVATCVDALSAHRAPSEVIKIAENASGQGIKVIIAAAGGAAHLPGVIAAHTNLPVIGVPISGSEGLGGLDALLSIAQMPPGVPVATVAVNGAKNAAILAAQILALCPENLAIATRLATFRENMAEAVKVASNELNQLGIERYLELHPSMSKR